MWKGKYDLCLDFLGSPEKNEGRYIVKNWM